MKARRNLWRAQCPRLDAARLVFIDETWLKTNMTRMYGRAPMGERLVDAVPHGHWKTTTFLAGLRVDGLSAPLVVDGAINGDIFRAYIEQHLAPTLRPGDGVVMDNLSSHKVAGVREALAAVKARPVYLPPYSPDFNPIEHVFAKLKAWLRKYGERTREGLWRRIGSLVDIFSSQECRRYLSHCGYAPR